MAKLPTEDWTLFKSINQKYCEGQLKDTKQSKMKNSKDLALKQAYFKSVFSLSGEDKVMLFRKVCTGFVCVSSKTEYLYVCPPKIKCSY